MGVADLSNGTFTCFPRIDMNKDSLVPSCADEKLFAYVDDSGDLSGVRVKAVQDCSIISINLHNVSRMITYDNLTI